MTEPSPRAGGLVSVIVPCYNAAKFVRESLETVFAQTHSALEVVVVDDGSTDGTLSILEELRLSGRKFLLIRQEHLGASAARNRGTGASSGRYLQYFDADDLLAPDAISKKVRAIEDSGADVAYSDWQRISEGTDGVYRSGEIVARNMEDIDPSPEISIFTDFWAPPAALLYSRKIVDKIGGWKESLPVIQDARFLLDAALSGASFVRVPEVTAFYRAHRKDSLSSRNPRAFLEDVYAQARDVEALWAREGGLSRERKRALLKVLGFVARQSFGSDEPLYSKVRRAIRDIEPNYVPESPRSLRWISLLMGYDRAEALSALGRRFRKKMIKASE